MILTVLKSLGVAAAGYMGWCFLTVPLPKGLRKPIQVRMLLTVFKLQDLYNNIAITFGFTSTLKARRKAMDSLRDAVAKAKISRRHLEIRDSTLGSVKVRLYIPNDAAPKGRGHPALVFYHGGGWVCGNPGMYDGFFVRLLRDMDIVVVNVDYRMAPEFVFPAPLDDCVNATKYFINHAHEFGADPERVAVAGDSAGGNLAAAVAMTLRDEGFSPRPKHQLLLYPALQALDLNTPSMVQNRNGPIITQAHMGWFWSQYICGSDRLSEVFVRNGHTSREVKETLYKNELDHGSIAREFLYKPYNGPKTGDVDEAVWNELKHKLLNPYLSPLVASDLRGLPDAYVFTCQYDVLRDDGIMYAKRLRDSQVKVVHSNMKCGFHALLLFIGMVPEAKLLYDEITDYLKTKL